MRTLRHIPPETEKEKKTHELAAWAEENAGAGKGLLSPYPKRDLYPLTENQRGILVDWEQNRGTTQYNIPMVTVFEGVEGETLVAAVKAALSAHGYLKTRFVYAEGDVMQKRGDEEEPEVLLRPLDREPDGAFFQSRILPFDLFADRLYRLEVYTFEGRAWLFADIHHTVYDGLSDNVFLGEVRRALKGERLKGETLTAYDFALYEQELHGSETYAEAKTYFDRLVEGVTPAALPDSRRPDGKPMGTVKLQIPAREIKEFCREAGVKRGSFFQAAFGETLRRLTREEKPFYLTVDNGRSAFPELMDTVGMFVKTLPVAVKESGDMTSEEYVISVHRQLQESCDREFYPYTELVERHGLRGEIMFVYQGKVLNWDARFSPVNGLELDVAIFPITAELRSVEEDYVLTVEYDGRRYSRADMESFAKMVKNEALGLASKEYVRETSLVSAEEAEKILELSAGKKLAYDQGETWLDMFRSHVQNAPEKTAVVDSEGSFTYGELDSASNSIAEWLLEKGVKSGSFVALKMGRVKEFMAAVIAIHKVGAAYVPMDPKYPEERTRYMLEDSEAKAVLTEETVAEALAKYPKAESVNRAAPEGRAYMIYTSGSTGRPKGVVQSHRSLRALVAWMLDKFDIAEESVHAEHPSFSFDASLMDLFCPLSAGGTLHIFSEALIRDMAEMKEYMVGHHISMATFSTQIGMAMVNQYPELPLRYLMMGGEKMLPCKKTDIRLINGYGPTEFTVCSSYHVVDQEKDTDIPIGRPVPNTYSFICDSYGHLLPQGMTGELCLAGNQIAEGYWKKPELTAKSFVTCPFLPGHKMYRTGDLARYNEAGELEYLGRIDNQVKLRGFRIEMGEIENRAGQFAGIAQVAAAVKKDQLVLYYTSAESTQIDAEQLRSFLSETLTEYMVPTVYMPLDLMPMTPNGKIDRKALPEPEWKGAVYEEPANERERALAEAFGEILGVREKIGALDDFFRLGGDSIKAIRLVSRLRERGIRVSVADIMSQKTVRGIAFRVEVSKEQVLSQEPYEGAVPDTAIVSFFKDLALPEPWHFNQCLLLSMRERANLPALQKALDALAFQHDLLRAVWRAGASCASVGAKQSHHAPAPTLAHPCASVGAKQSHHAPAPTLAHPCASEEHLFVRASGATLAIEEYRVSSEEEITKICNDIQSHIHMEEALVRVALIHGRENDHLFIAAHHLVVDGVSWRILAGDLERAYGAALSGTAIRLPEKTHTYRDYAEALRRYRDSYALRQEISYWEAAEGKMKELPLSKAKDYSRSFGKLVVTMEREDTARFLRGAFEKIRGDVNDALLAAVGRSFAKVRGVSAVSFQMEGHGRENLGEPLMTDRTVGWFTSVYPMVVDGLTGDLLHDLLATKEALHRVPNKGVGYNVLRFVEGERKVEFTSDLVAQIGFNYLGDMSVEEGEGESHFTESPINTGDSFSRKNIFGPDLSINCQVGDGCFSLHLAYARNVYDSDTAQRFARGILDEMRGISSFLKEYDGSRLTATDLGENEWSEEEFEAVLADFAARGERIERIYPLLPMQEGMLLKHVTEPESWGYRLVDVYEMDWVPEESQLRRALARLGKKHEVLRTAILHENVSVPRQAIIDRPLGLSMRDLSGEADPEAAVKRLREKILVGGFDLEKKPLFHLTCAKKDGESSYLLLAVHHIIVDGWCIRLYLGDLARYLKEEKQGGLTEDTEAPMTGAYESAVRELLRQDREQGLAYWRGLLEGYETKAEIPSFGEVPEEERAAEDECHIALDEDTTERLVDLCRKAGATPGNGVELLWGLVLSVCSRTEDVVFAKVVSGRDHTETDVNDLVGLLINSVPVRLKLEKTTTAQEALSALQEQTAESNRYDYCPLASIQQQTSLGANLFQTVLAFENYNSGQEDTREKDFLRPLVMREEHFDEINPSAYILDGQLTFRISFRPSKYREREIQRVLGLFRTLAEGIVRHPEQPLSSLARLNPEEREEMLRLSRGEELEYNKEETWLDLFQSHAKNTPEKTAVVDSKGAFTYGELERASDGIAAWLLEKGVKEGSFVALKMGRVKEFLASVIAVHKVGAGYVPIDPEYPEERTRYMLEDSEAKAVLTEETVAEALAKYPEGASVNHATPAGCAYMIYTSGSTGTPKGAVISHRALRAYAAWMQAEFHITEASIHAVHASFSFDGSIIDTIPLLAAGGTIHILSAELRMDMEGMRDYFAKNRVESVFLTTRLGMAMVNQYPDAPLRRLMMGGEKLLPCKKTDIQLVNGYGPTEFTVYSSYHVINWQEGQNIPIGRPAPNTCSFICDPCGQLLPQGMAGELFLAGNQIADGYWRRPELTARSFVDCPFLPGQKMYRTGDLARYNEEGELEYLGRIDHQVKLRGFRIELGEIESRASRFEGIAQVAAAVKKEQLVLYYTSAENAQIDAKELQNFLSETLTGYMVPTVYMPLALMPMTPNGKVNRKALPEPELAAMLENIPPATEREQKFYELAAGLLGTKDFGVTDNLVSLGLSSIGAMRLTGEIYRACALRIPVAEILRMPTIRSLAAWVEENASAGKEQLLPYPKRDLYPITENQRGILVDWEQNRETTQYNIPTVTVFDGVEGETLVSAVKAALSAHGYLKTRFIYKDGDVMQERRDEEEPVVSLRSLAKEPDAAFFQSRILPFDLFSDRLYRLEVYTFHHRAWLFADIHHTVYDGLSGNVFMGEIRRALKGESLKGETLTAYDLALYEQELQGGEPYAEAKAYFDGRMEGAVPAVLPDSRKPDGTPASTYKLQIPAGEINGFCAAHGVTPGSFFQAAFGETLRRLTREEKPFYLTVEGGRSASPALMDAVGMFVKTLPVAVLKAGDMTSKEYVISVHRKLQESYAREFYPYTELVERHGLRGEIMFVYQGGISDEEPQLGGTKRMELELDTAKLPISAVVLPNGEDYVLSVEYDGRRYSRADMESFATMVKHAALGLARKAHVKEIGLVSAEEGKTLLELSAGEKLTYNQKETWLDLFQSHAKNTPEKTAVVDSKGAFTYGELDSASNRIAEWLLEKGVRPGSFVALKMGRVKEFLAAVIAVHKVGAAYVPVDPEYPEERIQYMLEDSEAKAVLTEETAREAMAAFPDAAPVNRAVPEGRAYMIYTSGSTGKPKGVVQSHFSLRAFVAWRLAKFGITEESVHALHASFSFDASLDDMICPIAAGGTIHILSEDLRRDIGGMGDYFAEHHIRMVTFSTQLGMAMVNQSPELPLRYLMMGGEKMLPCKRTDIRLINGYGPTEFTVCSSYHVVDQEKDADIPIGRPVPNTWSFICDPCGHLLPQGMAGELCLAGPQIAEGYWKKPELTERSFAPCSFLPGQKMYRTGDLARYNEDGELEYLGRMDSQVKLRGFRIEMGEIENRASQFDGIEQVAAAVKKDQLVLYYAAAKGMEIDPAELRDFLAKTLTEYMVPTVYMPLAAMPMTPSGKIDRKALPEPERKERVIDPPENELQATLCGFFRKALELKEVGVNEDFFELGGNSLKAAQMLMAARLKELPISYQDIFDAKTVRRLEAAIEQKRRGESALPLPSPKAAEPTEAELAALAHNRNDYVDEIGKGSLGNVLLTGATGFLGAHVLRYLLEHTEEKIYCLLRPHGKDVRQKLENLLFYYFENDYAGEFDRRLFALEGDITNPESLESTAGLDYHTVINCAASVKHFADMEFLKAVNVHGVENLTRLCLEKGARLVQISTTSVGGEAVGGLKSGQMLREDSLDIGQDVESNAYVYTKYLAEKHVLKSIEEKGLDGKIIRVGNLSSRVRDGEFQINFSTNAFMNTLRAYAVLGCYPFAGMSEPVELSYIDETARAAVLLSGTGRDFTVFHAYNGYTVKMGDIVTAMNHCGIPVECVAIEEFKRRLQEGLTREDINGYLSVLVRYGQEDSEKLEAIPKDNRFTLNALYRLGFHWTITDVTIIEQMLDALKTLGFFDCAIETNSML